MAFYCSDCVTWVNSKDANRYGEKWCDYDQKYRSADQKIYDCRGFVWAKRSIITKVCEILNIDPTSYFKAFDDTKEIILIPSCVDKLIDYNTVGPVIAERIDQAEARIPLAQYILDSYIKPAYERCAEKDYQGAVNIYEKMVKTFAIMFKATKMEVTDDFMIQNPINAELFMDRKLGL